MPTWLRRVRGVLGMGVIWAVGGACVGGAIELLDNVLPGRLAFIARVDMWPQTLAIPGFISGALFATVLMLANLRARTRGDSSAMSFSRFASIGAIAGILLGAIAMTIGAPLLFVVATTVWGVTAASGSFLFARRATTRAQLELGDSDDSTDAPATEPPKTLTG